MSRIGQIFPQPISGGGGGGSNAELGVVIDGGGATPTTGSKHFLSVAYACTINSWVMLADVAGSAQITVKKSSYAGFPATTSIVGSAPPKLVSQQNNQSSTLTGWTTAINAGDILEFNLDSVSTVGWLQLVLQISK